MIDTTTIEERQAKQRAEALDKANAVRSRRAVAYRQVRGPRSLPASVRRVQGVERVAALLRDPGPLGDLGAVRLVASIPRMTTQRATKVLGAAGVRRPSIQVAALTPETREAVALNVERWGAPPVRKRVPRPKRPPLPLVTAVGVAVTSRKNPAPVHALRPVGGVLRLACKPDARAREVSSAVADVEPSRRCHRPGCAVAFAAIDAVNA